MGQGNRVGGEAEELNLSECSPQGAIFPKRKCGTGETLQIQS